MCVGANADASAVSSEECKHFRTVLGESKAARNAALAGNDSAARTLSSAGATAGVLLVTAAAVAL